MRKALFSVLFILFAGIFSCNAQLQKITSYYNNDSSLVNEQYFVLSSDTDIKDSLYNNYSKEGKLLKKGFYNKGDKMGEWVHFFPDRQIKSSGYYNMNKQFCGCHFSYNINGEIEQVDYYIDDIAYNDSIQVQEEFVRKLVEALHTTGFDVYDIMQEKFLSLQTMFAKYDSIENADEKLVFGHRIVQSGYFFKEWFNSFKSERELLLKSKSVMDAFTADIDKDYFDLLMNPIVENADSLLNSDNIIFVLDDGSKIRKEFIQISGLISEIEIIEPQITSGLSELESNYKDEFPEFYKSELDQFSKKHDDYKQEENLQIKISLGNEIVSLIEKMKADFEKLTNLSESIDEKLNKLEKVYKEKFPVDYQAEEELINSDYAGFKASTQLQEKIELGQIVLKHIETSYINFYTVDSMDIVIAEEFKSIREGYLQSFAAIYGKEIKPVANSIAGFNRTKGLEIKIMTGQNILDTIHYFDAAYTRFIDIDKALKERYSKLQSNFKEGYRAIYKNEVAQMDKLIKNYNVNGRSKSKLDVGNNIMEKIIELENNYSEIGKQSDEIGNRYTAVSEKFKSDFSPVYKYTLCTYDDKKENYEKSLNCKTYLEKGKAFLEEVTILEEKYDEISKQYSSIIEILSKVEGLY
ncbi:MAG: hypothetical protein U9R19_03165, partial [Bacteroidota bacterium]|nr:hypothetical protein [Bacteroidota bacterium]